MAASSFTDAKVIEMSRNFVNLLGDPLQTHGEKDVIVGQGKVRVCSRYLTVSCVIHLRGHGQVTRFYTVNYATPTLVFCDPSGKELSRHEQVRDTAELLKKMQEALDKVPGEKVNFDTVQQAKRLVADGDAQLKKGDAKKAIEVYNKVARIRGPLFKAMSDEALKKADESGRALLKDALALASVDDKKKALRKIADDYKPLSVAAEAKKELDALK